MTPAESQRWRKRLFGEFSLWRVVRTLITVYISVLVWAYLYSDSIAFQPHPASYAAGKDISFVTVPDGGRVAMLSLPNPGAAYAILYVHGNAEDLGDIRGFLEDYQANGFEVYAFDYRGYGLSIGRASTPNSYEDIEAVYRYLVRERKLDPRRLIIHGRSLGAAIGLHLGTRRPVAGMIVESGFLSQYRVRTQICISPFDKMRNDVEIRKLNRPVFFIHGQRDDVIATWQGKRLYELAKEPKCCYWVPRAGHNDVAFVNPSEYWRHIRVFASLLGRSE